MELDILEFQVPMENSKTLFVWDIEPSHTKTQVHDELYSVFSTFGPLYLLKVCSNTAQNPPGFYALIKFYSAVQASKAQSQIDGHSLFQSSPVKVRLSSRQTPHFCSESSRPLSHTHCVELANHYLGFNGWTSDIISLKELTNEEEEEEEDGARCRKLTFGCLLQLSFPYHQQMTRGAAVVEDSFICTDESGVEELQRRCKLQRLVRERALVQAFTTVLLVLLGDGKVMVEMKQASDQLLPEHIEGLVQVTEFTPVEREEEWDQTVS